MANGGWKIARSRGGAQVPIALLGALAVVLILAGKAQSNLFDRARANVTDWASPAMQAFHGPLSGVDRWLTSIGSVFRVYEENRQLKEENARLKQWRNQAVLLDSKVKRYQLLLRAVPDPALSTVMAQVIGRANRPFLQTMILDAGKAQGVKPGQGVVDARGMIGRIFLTGDHTSWVILLTDLNSRIPVTIVPGNVQAIMAGDNSGAPVLDLLAQNVRLKPGDQVVSSGDGGLLPPGLAIGTVVAGSGGGYRVLLLADPSTSEDVNIVDFKLKAEMPPAVSPSDLPATAAGLPPAAPPPPVVAPTIPPVVPGSAAGAASGPGAAGNSSVPKPGAPASPKPAAAPDDGADATNE
jgi:rod shape-determining protein MreC